MSRIFGIAQVVKVGPDNFTWYVIQPRNDIDVVFIDPDKFPYLPNHFSSHRDCRDWLKSAGYDVSHLPEHYIDSDDAGRYPWNLRKR